MLIGADMFFHLFVCLFIRLSVIWAVNPVYFFIHPSCDIFFFAALALFHLGAFLPAQKLSLDGRQTTFSKEGDKSR